MAGQLPKRVGESGHTIVQPEKVKAFSVLQLSQATSWTHLTDTHTLFTPAMVYLSVPLIQDPFDAFQQDTGVSIEPQQLIAESGIPLFSGLTIGATADLSWNYQVLCAPTDLVTRLHEWVRTTKYLDSARGLLWQPKIQRILVRDDAARWQGDGLRRLGPPKVLVEAWSVNTTRGRMFFGEPDATDHRYVVPAKFSPEVDGDLTAFRDRLIQGTNPYGVE